MDLISFNTWGGRVGLEKLESFFSKYKNTDVFCLQEIWQSDKPDEIPVFKGKPIANLLERISEFLPNHTYYFRPQYRGIYGLATFIKKDITIINEGELFVFKEQGYENPESIGNHARNIQYTTLSTKRGPLTIINFHGLWNGQGKDDSDDRILQSKKIADFIQKTNEPLILLGDFNLNPDTESIKILEAACPQNLIRDYQITSTRSSLYEKPGRYADYVLAKENIKVSDFQVLPDEASDHLALYTQLDWQL